MTRARPRRSGQPSVRPRVALCWCAAAGGCAAPASAPWWPAPAVAQPSPLLDLVGVAPPPLTGLGCSRGARPPWRFAGWRGTANYFVHGPTVACVVPVAANAGAAPVRTATVLTDARGRVYGVDWTGPVQSPAAAARAADSTLRRGLEAPGAAACDSEPPRPGPPGWPSWPAVRGWRTPAYEALVFVTQANYPEAHGHVLRVAVGRGFGPCRRAAGAPGR